MKRTILLTGLLLFFSATIHAQLDKGRIQIGGIIGASQQKYEANSFNPKIKNSNVFISPSIGSFYARNKMIGFSLLFGYSESTNSSSLTRSYGGGVFLRQYIPVIPKLYVLFHEGLDYRYLSGHDILGSIHGYNLNLNIGTGMAYDITRRMQLELLLTNLGSAGYSKTNRDESYYINSSLEGNSFSGITLGFRYYLK